MSTLSNIDQNLNECPTIFELNTVINLLQNKLRTIKESQKSQHISSLLKSINNKNYYALQELNFTKDEINDYLNNTSKHIEGIEQNFNANINEINLISQRLLELKMLSDLKIQINKIEKHYLGVVINENKNLFLFHLMSRK